VIEVAIGYDEIDAASSHAAVETIIIHKLRLAGAPIGPDDVALRAGHVSLRNAPDSGCWVITWSSIQ